MNPPRDWRTALFSGQLHADRFKVRRLLELATEGRLRVPRFQRPLRWQREQEADLFDSLLRRFPIGTLLLWEKEAPADELRFKDLVIHADAQRAAFWIVDGQQRVNTLVGSLLRPDGMGAVRRTELFFDLEEGRFVWRKEFEDQRFIPVRRLRSAVEVSRWARQTGSGEDLHDLAVMSSTAILDYEVPAYTTSVLDDRVLREVFTRVNTRGTAMRETEVFYALNQGSTEGSTVSTRFDHALNEVAYALSFGRIHETTRMKVIQAVAEVSPRSGAVLHQQVDALLPVLPKAAAALQRAISFLKDEAEIPNADLLPGDLPLVVLSHLFHRFPEVCERSVELLDRWVWRSAVASRLSLTNEHLHRAFRAVQGASHEEEAVQALIEAAPRVPPPDLPTPSRVNRRGSTTRLALLWLWSLEPRGLASSEDSGREDLDAGDTEDPDTAAEPWEPDEQEPWMRLPCADGELRRLVGAVLLHRKLNESAARELADASTEVLQSHALEDGDREAIREGRWDELTRLRQERIRLGMAAMIRRHCAWEVDDDGPSIAYTAFTEPP